MERRTIAAGVLGSIAIVGLVSLAIAIATRPEPEVAGAVPIDAGPAPIDAGIDAGQPTAIVADAGPYELDDLPRTPELAAAGCPDVPLIDRATTDGSIPWRPALRIHPAFEPTVRDIERAITAAAQARYGRAPRVLLSASSHRCRTIRDRPERLSEHALGNALDVRGIVISGDGGEIEITVRDHWNDGSIHDRFLHDAIRAVIASPIVRGVIGPPDPQHLDHFHVDRGPSRFTSIALDPPP